MDRQTRRNSALTVAAVFVLGIVVPALRPGAELHAKGPEPMLEAPVTRPHADTPAHGTAAREAGPSESPHTIG